MVPILMAIRTALHADSEAQHFTLKLQISGERRIRTTTVGIFGSYPPAYVLAFIMTVTLYPLPYGKGLNMRKAKYTRHAHTGKDNGKTTKRNYRAVLLRG